jgi:hypothetical protein
MPQLVHLLPGAGEPIEFPRLDVPPLANTGSRFDDQLALTCIVHALELGDPT